jgi:hypothetical protein
VNCRTRSGSMPNYHRQTRYTVTLPDGETVGEVRYEEKVDGWRFFMLLDDKTLWRPRRKTSKTADGAVPAWAREAGAKCV